MTAVQITVNGTPCRVHRNAVCRYVIWSEKAGGNAARTAGQKKADGAAPPPAARAEVRLTAPVDSALASALAGAVLRPLSRGVLPEILGNRLCFSAPVPSKWSLEFPGSQEPPVFFFLYAAEPEPDPGEGVRVFAPGEHHVDELVLHSGETLYLAEGAVLHAHLVAVGERNVTVCGRGILDIDGEYSGKGRRMTHLYDCSGLTFRDITMTGSYGWSLVFTGCRDVTVDGVNILTWRCTGDGIDVVGFSDVTVRGCFIRTADDCIAIKATDYRGEAGLRDVRRVSVSDCVLWNAVPGNGIEIGFETRCEEIADIRFSDIDLIHCEHEGWQSGASIAIHNGDRARIHDVVYRNIRIEDSVDKLFDFKVLRSNYSKDEKRGSIGQILVENVAVISGAFPPSILSGYAPEDALVRDVRFAHVTAYGQPIRSAVECRMVAERTKNIVFEAEDEKR